MKAHLITLAIIAIGLFLIVKLPLVFLGIITLAVLGCIFGCIYGVIYLAISRYL